MGLRIELLDDNNNPTGVYLSQGDMSSPLETYHWTRLDPPRNEVVKRIRIVNDTPSQYEYMNVRLTAYEVMGGSPDPYMYVRPVGSSSWSPICVSGYTYSVTVGTVQTASDPIEIKVGVSNTLEGGPYTLTHWKLKLIYDEVDLSQLPPS